MRIPQEVIHAIAHGLDIDNLILAFNNTILLLTYPNDYIFWNHPHQLATNHSANEKY